MGYQTLAWSTTSLVGLAELVGLVELVGLGWSWSADQGNLVLLVLLVWLN